MKKHEINQEIYRRSKDQRNKETEWIANKDQEMENKHQNMFKNKQNKKQIKIKRQTYHIITYEEAAEAIITKPRESNT